MKFILKSIQGFIQAVKRFPLSVTALAAETGLLWYTISLDRDPGLVIFKVIFILAVAAVMGAAVQFLVERFDRSLKFKLISYGLALLLIGGYALIIWPSPEIDYLVATRTFVAVFALICATLYIPSIKKAFEFNLSALAHFQAAYTALLYAVVLFVGLALTLASIDLLLFKIDNKYFGYTAALVFVFFAVVYFLSLLPDFNSSDAKDLEITAERTKFPKLISILISYIAIPLVSIYTLVLFSYFIKIVITRVWPIGQLGPMVLGYSIAGLVVYILASSLSNAFAKLYQRYFPMVWIPIAIVQLISIWIRLNAYGITESRYYLTLSALYSLGMGLYLSFKPVHFNRNLVLVAMILALGSIIPPVDAFSVSRASQKARLTTILENANLLVDGTIVPSEEVSITDRKEITSILWYLSDRKYLTDLAWLPEGFEYPMDFKDTFGFDTAYADASVADSFYAYLDYNSELPIEGYFALYRYNIYRDNTTSTYPVKTFEVEGQQYTLHVQREDAKDSSIQILDASNTVVLETHLYPFIAQLRSSTDLAKDSMNATDMMLDVSNDQFKLRIIFQAINIYQDQGDYDCFVLIGKTTP